MRRTSSNDGGNASIQYEINPNALLEQTNEDELPITYACEYQTGSDPLTTNKFDVVTVEQFYDLVYPCADDKESAANNISEQLLMEAAVLWHLFPDGEACTNPQNAYGAWLFGVSSAGSHEFVSDFGCQRLTPNDTMRECCHVVRSKMQFIPTGGYNATMLKQFVKDQLDGAETPYSLIFRTASIEPFFVQNQPNDGGHGNLNEPKRVPGGVQAGQDPQQSPSNRKITVPGGFLIALLVAALAGVFFVLYRRNRKERASAGDTVGKADDDFCNSTMEHGLSCEGDFFVTVSAIENEKANISSFQQRFHQKQQRLNSSFDEMDLDDMPLEEYPPTKYAFDLGESFKNDVMGTYAPTTMQVVAPYPMMEDTSCDSEADSWAQTDGTVGSLEDRLEEITAEI